MNCQLLKKTIAGNKTLVKTIMTGLVNRLHCGFCLNKNDKGYEKYSTVFSDPNVGLKLFFEFTLIKLKNKLLICKSF